MKRVGTLFLILFLSLLSLNSSVQASGSSPLLITEVQVGIGNANNEFVEIYNNSTGVVDLTGWQLQFLTQNFASPIDPNAAPTRRLATLSGSLPAGSFMLFINPDYGSPPVSLTLGINMFEVGGSALASGNGYVRVVKPDQINPLMGDCMKWGGAATTPLPCTRVSGSNTSDEHSLQRPFINGQYDGTSIISVNPITPGSLLDLTPPPPSAEDECPNIDGIQSGVPSGYYVDENGNCVETPMSPTPVLDNKALRITEMLPDAVGSDTGNEFIEIYNPHDEPVGFGGYKLHVGPNFEKVINLPSNLEISPKQYLAFYNSSLSFTLVNTSSRVKLTAPNGNTVSETESYQSPKAGLSWSLFEDGWKMTQKATPDAENKYVWDATADKSSSGLAPCPAGKFRNPATNRCKNIASASSALKACAADQFRNPETNRCKKIASASSTLTPCKPGQERNPETNRCRKIGADSKTPKPCQPGQERNPDTNRCRKIKAANSTLGAPAAINPISMNSRIVSLLIAMAAGYAAFEYKTDIKNWLNRLRNKRGDPRPPG